jgi:parvulin-like peptidyl-prolyl isomerase
MRAAARVVGCAAAMAAACALMCGITAAQIVVDRVIARVDKNVILLSELRELGQFQQVVEGKQEPEEKRLDELIDQWIIEQEATSAGSKTPTADEVRAAEQHLANEAGGEEQFRAREAQAGLSDSALQRQLIRALFFSRYVDYKFRPAAQIDPAAIQKYYDEQFVPQSKARGQAVPELSAVTEQIREVLVQQAITDRADQWLAESRSRMKIDILLHSPALGGGNSNE